MYIIEPCCAVRQVMLLRDAIGKDGTKEFMGYGDLSLTELLPAILTRYTETELLIAAPTMPDQAAEVIGKWMRQQWSRADGGGKLDVIRHLTIIADLSKKKSPMVNGWLRDNPFGDRLTLVSQRQADTVILLPDFAVAGPVNMRYGDPFTAAATGDAERITALWKQYVNPAEDCNTTLRPQVGEPAGTVEVAEEAEEESVADNPTAEATGAVMSESSGTETEMVVDPGSDE